MPRSLLDRVALAPLRAHATGGAAGVLAVLLRGGALAHDPSEPGWPDRDRLVVDGQGLGRAAAAAFAAAGYPEGGAGAWTAARRGQALGLALGAAAASRADGGIYRVCCLLDAPSWEHGAVWEAARSAGRNHLAPLCLVSLSTPPGVAGVLRAAGWALAGTRAGEPAELLGALDRALEPGSQPGAVLVEEPR